jgi:hypothetical protein
VTPALVSAGPSGACNGVSTTRRGCPAPTGWPAGGHWIRRCGSEPVCRICGRRWSLRHGALHHRSYQRLGHEADSDLVALCREPCHLLLHQVLESNPAWLKAGRPYATDTIIAVLRARSRQGEGAHDRT